MARFTGKTVIVTGAGSGMGEATAKQFSAEGANVVVTGRTKDKLEAAMVGLPSDRTIVMPGDVSNRDDAAALVKAAVDRFGGLDILVNNAGVAKQGSVTSVDREDWDQVIAVNVTGAFNMARAAMPELIKTKGNIVQVSSVSGIGGDWGMMAYNASKGALSNMTRAMALDAGRHGVRVNEVNPSLTDTGMTQGMMDNEKLIAKFMARIPMQRIGQPEDVARVICFLASDDAGFVTGVSIPVDGGLSASNGQPNMGE